MVMLYHQCIWRHFFYSLQTKTLSLSDNLRSKLAENNKKKLQKIIQKKYSYLSYNFCLSYIYIYIRRSYQKVLRSTQKRKVLLNNFGVGTLSFLKKTLIIWISSSSFMRFLSISLLNGIPTFLSYLTPKPSL